MVHKVTEQEHVTKENVRGGVGVIETDMVFKPEELLGKATVFNRMTLKPGSTVGGHSHTVDAEIYYVLEGEVTGVDNGEEIVMGPGDAMFTGGGASHAMENRSAKDATILAIVIA